ncbi:hypothetical protein C1645_748628 [Glomus cerebriforme]|uniref:Putative restriction endonuclease domain-containing protein n=1 Tax=Glomus cerebriforme TaxID=658196 RepID=A0A397TKT4_9GLOM|nr:hypothetical protein C1645_748628 [Glomus cerebriforme]
MDISKQKKKQIDLENLNLDLRYTIEEFEFINKQLKSTTLEINGQPVNLFEIDKSGKLTPMPQVPVKMKGVVSEIVGQLSTWNVWTRQNGIITTSQGGYDFNVGGQRKIIAPDVAFLTRDAYNRLTKQQRQTLQGAPFSPTFVVEVADLSQNSNFKRLDDKIKDDYFAPESNVQLAWLIDPVNKAIHLYRRGKKRHPWGWKDIGGVWKIEEVIEESESDRSQSSGSPSKVQLQEIWMILTVLDAMNMYANDDDDEDTYEEELGIN